jgi:hypothetical protein
VCTRGSSRAAARGRSTYVDGTQRRSLRAARLTHPPTGLRKSLMRPVLFVLACTVLEGCTNLAASLTGTLLTTGPKGPVSDIRVRNASSLTLRNVIVANVHYGDLGAGETTDYKSWGPAYPHPRVRLELDGTRLRCGPLYHWGQLALGGGRFTYVLTVGAPRFESDLSVTLVKD